MAEAFRVNFRRVEMFENSNVDPMEQGPQVHPGTVSQSTKDGSGFLSSTGGFFWVWGYVPEVCWILLDAWRKRP